MYDYTPILARLKAAKKASNLTNDELAVKSNVPVGTINKILSGDTKEPKLPAFMSIASALGTSVDYLCYGTVPSSDANLSQDKKDLLDNYDLLNGNGQAAASSYVEYLTTRDEYKKIPPATAESCVGA